MSVAIVGVLAAFTVPAVTRLFASDALSRDVNLFVADAAFTRSEALRRGRPVAMCRSSDAQAAQPHCAGPEEPGGWHSGWIVYLDGDGDRQRSASEPVIKVQSSLSRSEVRVAPDAARLDSLRYLPTGWAPGPVAALRFVAPGGSPADPGLSRTACVSAVGRVHVLRAGANDCS